MSRPSKARCSQRSHVLQDAALAGTIARPTHDTSAPYYFEGFHHGPGYRSWRPARLGSALEGRNERSFRSVSPNTVSEPSRPTPTIGDNPGSSSTPTDIPSWRLCAASTSSGVRFFTFVSFHHTGQLAACPCPGPARTAGGCGHLRARLRQLRPACTVRIAVPDARGLSRLQRSAFVRGSTKEFDIVAVSPSGFGAPVLLRSQTLQFEQRSTAVTSLTRPTSRNEAKGDRWSAMWSKCEPLTFVQLTAVRIVAPGLAGLRTRFRLCCDGQPGRRKERSWMSECRRCFRATAGRV